MTQRIVQFFARRFSDSIRGIDTLIWALIWINVVGLGPFAGVLAIMTSDIGAFTKLYSEAIEAVDRNRRGRDLRRRIAAPRNPLRHRAPGDAGADQPDALLLESNTRSAPSSASSAPAASACNLAEQIRTYEWDKVAFIILMILVTVAIRCRLVAAPSRACGQERLFALNCPPNCHAPVATHRHAWSIRTHRVPTACCARSKNRHGGLLARRNP